MQKITNFSFYFCSRKNKGGQHYLKKVGSILLGSSEPILNTLRLASRHWRFDSSSIVSIAAYPIFTFSSNFPILQKLPKWNDPSIHKTDRERMKEKNVYHKNRKTKRELFLELGIWQVFDEKLRRTLLLLLFYYYFFAFVCGKPTKRDLPLVFLIF